MGRKALIVFALLVPLSVLGQGIGGSWAGRMAILPDVALDYNIFGLSYSPVEEWSLTSEADFLGTDGWVWQELGVSGSIASVDIDATFLFGPQAPAFIYSLIEASTELSGFELMVATAYVGPSVPGYVFTGGPSGGLATELSGKLDGVSFSMALGIGAKLEDLTITYTGASTYTKTYRVSPFPGGMRFTYLDIQAEGIPFCCGIGLDIGFGFTKQEGFNYLTFTFHSLAQLCCDIALDASVTFTTSSKRVSVTPHWRGIEGCMELYGDVDWDHNALQGLKLYGWKVRCEFADCNAIEILTALDPQGVEDTLEQDIFQGKEFEYIKISTCGSACCGGDWTLDAVAYFTSTVGNLFGISRLVIDSSVPLMDNLKVTGSLELVVPGAPSLFIGWELSF